MPNKIYSNRKLIIAFLFSLYSCGVYAVPYYVQNTNPWGQPTNIDIMNNVYGNGNWTQATYSTPAMTIFSPSTDMVWLEGGDANAYYLNLFLANNHVLIESWVTAGGKLIINAAPNTGGDIDCGFNGTTLHYPAYSGIAQAADANDTIFHGPFTPITTAYTGNLCSHAYITGSGLHYLLSGDSARVILAKRDWGLGRVYFGTLTPPVWWVPQVEAYNLWYNIMATIHTPPTPTAVGQLDSFEVYVNGSCNSGIELTAFKNNSYAGFGVKTYYGDNTMDSSSFGAANPTGGVFVIDHLFPCTGTYTIKQVLYNGPNAVDSLQFPYTYQSCRTLLVSFYYDANSNCIYDNEEIFSAQPLLTEVDSNNIPIDTVSATSGFYYTITGNTGDIFGFRPIMVGGGYYLTCPAAGILYDTLDVTNSTNMEFGLSCANGNIFDVSVVPVTHSGRHLASVILDVNNAYCSMMSATVSMNYSPKYNYSSSNAAVLYTAGQEVIWNIAALSSNTPQTIIANFSLATPQWLTIGDTVNYSFNIAPTAGDIDITNNTVIIHDTIDGAYDPNHIAVDPQGYIASGTKLKYSVMFENTGNAPAENIYVLDTLPDQVDINSLRMLSASSRMFTYIFESGGHNIVRFEFPNINLPDSVHYPDNCFGMFSFSINTFQGLPLGTFIDNGVGIYFDDNDVVMTNTVRNIIASPENVSYVNAVKNIKVFPNPATNELTINADKNIYHSYTISNSMGQTMIEQDIHNTQTTINIRLFPAGIYYITLKDSCGSEVRKFVRL